jgi:hypothetical protein
VFFIANVHCDNIEMRLHTDIKQMVDSKIFFFYMKIKIGDSKGQGKQIHLI